MKNSSWILCALDLSRMTYEFYILTVFLIVDFTFTSYQVKTIKNIPIVVMLLFYILVGVNYNIYEIFLVGEGVYMYIYIYIYMYITLTKVS